MRTWSIILAVLVIPWVAGAADEASWSLSSLDSLWAEGERDTAMAQLLTSLESLSPNEDTQNRITYLTRAGAWYKDLGTPAASEPLLREALELASATGDSSLACAPRRWLGAVLSALGRNEEARKQYERSQKLAIAVGDKEYEAWANVGLGWDDGLKHESQASLDHYRRAVDLFHEIGDDEAELWATLGTANARYFLSEYEAAGVAFAEVVTVARRAGFSRHEAIALNNTAGLRFALGRPDVSLKYYQRAVALWDSIGQDYERVPPALNLGSCLALLGREDEARRIFTEELGRCRENQYRDYEARALFKLARLDQETGNDTRAQKRFREVLELGDDLPVIETVEATLGLASLLSQADQLSEAKDILSKCSLQVSEDQTSLRRVRLDLALAQVNLRLGEPEAAGELLDHADRILGQARGRQGLELENLRAEYWFAKGSRDSARLSLEAAAKIWDQQRGLPLDPEWREERGATGRMIFCRLAVEIAAAEGPGAAFERLQMFKARVLRERRWGPGRRSEEASEDSLPAVSLQEFQDQTLEDGELFLDCFAGKEQSLVFAVTKQDCRLLELPGDGELAPLLKRLHRWASGVDGDLTEIEKEASQISNLLLAGPTDWQRIIFSPDGVFNLVPTSLLLPNRPDTEWTRVPSSAILMDLRETGIRRQPLKNPRVLAVGGVVDPSKKDLPGANQELQSLDKTYQGVTVIRPNAGGTTPELDRLAGFDVIHVAAHSIGDDRNAWQSAIVLDPGNQEMMIRAADLVDLQLDTRLVVLASCSSATGRVLSGEGVQGLASAFLAAGVPSVVAALWPVDDDATEFFMSNFYGGLAQGLSASTALTQARVICRQDPVFHLPFHWAAFVLVGDGQVQVPLEVKNGWGGTALMLTILAALGTMVGLVWYWRSGK